MITVRYLVFSFLILYLLIYSIISDLEVVEVTKLLIISFICNIIYPIRSKVDGEWLRFIYELFIEIIGTYLTAFISSSIIFIYLIGFMRFDFLNLVTMFMSGCVSLISFSHIVKKCD